MPSGQPLKITVSSSASASKIGQAARQNFFGHMSALSWREAGSNSDHLHLLPSSVACTHQVGRAESQAKLSIKEGHG